MAISGMSGLGDRGPKKTQIDLLYAKLTHLVCDSECWQWCDALRFPSLLFFKKEEAPLCLTSTSKPVANELVWFAPQQPQYILKFDVA